MWRAFDSKKSCSVLLGGKQPVLHFRLPLGLTHPHTGLLLLKNKNKKHSILRKVFTVAQWAIPPRLWSSLCLARYPPSRLPPQGLGTGCSLCLEGSPQISTWPAHSSRLSLWDFPGGPVVKYLPCKARDVSLILAWGTKIPHAKPETPHSQINVFLKKQRTSLVAQCLEFACQCQGHGFHP